MNNSFGSRLKRAWNVFTNRSPTYEMAYNGISSSYRPDRIRMSRGNERSIITSIYNRIALDVAAINIKHVRLDENGRYKETIDSSLNNCLTLEANIDQTNRMLIQDLVMSCMDEGSVAVVPVDTDINPELDKNGNEISPFKIYTLRVGRIVEWYPTKVKVSLYNEVKGTKEDVIVPKRMAAIIENPFYAVMNEPNSTMQRLVRKLNILDAIDTQSGSGKLDVIIQLPYAIKSKLKRDQAEERRKQVEDQLYNSKYGIAYIDGTEHVTQLNRPVENNLMGQIEYLTSMLYSQLGMTQSVLDGTADEKTMLNYNNRTVEPWLIAITTEFKRKFISKTARSQGQSIEYFRDPFKLVPISTLAEIADKFTRNEIASSNELRQIVGWKPSDDPEADRLLNKNLNHPEPKENPVDSKDAGIDKAQKIVNNLVLNDKEEEIQNA